MHALAALAFMTLTTPAAPEPAPLVQLPAMEILAEAKPEVRPFRTRRTRRALAIPVPEKIVLHESATAPRADEDWMENPLWMHRLNPAQLRLYEAWLPSLDWDKVRWWGGTGWTGEPKTPSSETMEPPVPSPPAP